MGWQKRGKGHNNLSGLIKLLKAEFSVVFICTLFSGANRLKGYFIVYEDVYFYLFIFYYLHVSPCICLFNYLFFVYYHYDI